MKKTLTQVVLPIVALAGLVGGITYIANYTSPDSNKKDDKGKTTHSEAIKFTLTTAESGSNDWTRYWKSDYEVDKIGYFDFWCRNENDQPVTLKANGVSCQCAGADAAVVPQETLNKYLINKAAAGLSLLPMPAGPTLDAFNVIALRNDLQFQQVISSTEKNDLTIPGAPVSTDETQRAAHMNRANPQLAIVRLKWKAKPQENPDKDAKVDVTGEFTWRLPNATAVRFDLKAHFAVVQPFHIYLPSGGKTNDVRLGDILSGGVSSREIICWSKTRTELPLSFEPPASASYKDCVVVSEPRYLTPSEIADLENKLRTPEQSPKVLSAVRVFLTVHEQRTVERDGQKTLKQLDLGPLVFYLDVSAPDTRKVSLVVHGVVRGDARLLNTNSNATDAVDFNQSFSSRETKMQKVIVISDRSGLDLELLDSERFPQELKAELILKSETDGRKTWELQVTIPAGTLFGELPLSAQVVLQTKDPSPRRMRIPVRAKTLN